MDRPWIAADTATVEAIETMMDKYGSVQVIDAIADILMAKASHVQENWQDSALSKDLGKAGKAVNSFAHNKLNQIAGDTF